MRSRRGTWLAAAAALAVGLVPIGTSTAQADSAWPMINGNAQHTRAGGAIGPTNPVVKWSWQDDQFVASGGIGGTRTAMPGVLDDQGRLLFKAKNMKFDDIPGVSTRYDLLALDPDTGEAEILLPDVEGDYCVPAVAPDGTVWSFQSVNERTEPATQTNPAHGEKGHVHGHDRDSDAWLVKVDPATGEVTRVYSGDGQPGDHKGVRGCQTAITIAGDGTVLFFDSARDNWLRAFTPSGALKWQVNFAETYHEPRDWQHTNNWMLVAAQGTSAEGTFYLGYRQNDEETDSYHPALASFDVATGELIDTIDLPGARFDGGPVMDPEGGIIVAIEGHGGWWSGDLLRVVDNDGDLGVDWQHAIEHDSDATDTFRGVPQSMAIAGQHVVGFFGDTLYSFDWADGDFGWNNDVGLIHTSQVAVDSAGKIYVAKRSGGDPRNDPKVQVYSPRGTKVGQINGDQMAGLRTVGPIGADGTLFGWGNNTWYALEQARPGDVVPCPDGTSQTVTCSLNPARGYEMVGTKAAETFIGSARPDKMVGRGGEDSMRGRGGPDKLRGGAGSDRLTGNGGRDDLIGNGGGDRLTGNAGRDRFVAGPGRDVVRAHGQRRERVNCGAARDRVVGARGDRIARNCERVRR